MPASGACSCGLLLSACGAYRPAHPRRRRAALRRTFGEEIDQLFRHRAAELFGIENGDRAPIVTGNVVADTDRDELDRGLRLDLGDHLTQMLVEVVPRVHR